MGLAPLLATYPLGNQVMSLLAQHRGKPLSFADITRQLAAARRADYRAASVRLLEIAREKPVMDEISDPAKARRRRPRKTSFRKAAERRDAPDETVKQDSRDAPLHAILATLGLKERDCKRLFRQLKSLTPHRSSDEKCAAVAQEIERLGGMTAAHYRALVRKCDQLARKGRIGVDRMTRSTRYIPSPENVLFLIQQSEQAISIEGIAAHFGIARKHEFYRTLPGILASLQEKGLIVKVPSKTAYTATDPLPGLHVSAVSSVRNIGIYCVPQDWPDNRPVPDVLLPQRHLRGLQLRQGDRFLLDTGRWRSEHMDGSVQRYLNGETNIRIVGIFRHAASGIGHFYPVGLKSRFEVSARHNDHPGTDGTLSLARLVAGDGEARPTVILEKLLFKPGRPQDLSTIAIHNSGLPVSFSPQAVAEAVASSKRRLAQSSYRRDGRAIPFLSIDGRETQDFDDLIWAGPSGDGYDIAVAISDVANYVDPGGRLDREILERGNSTYCPDRAIHMCPDVLAKGICSLQPGKDRASFVILLHVNGEGETSLLGVTRQTVRSAARLTYQQAERIFMTGDYAPAGRAGKSLRHAHDAYRLLLKARWSRSPLEIDDPKTIVRLGKDLDIRSIRKEWHGEGRLMIEEYMVTANILMSEFMHSHGSTFIRRAQDAPDPARMKAVADKLEALGYYLPPGDPSTAAINDIIMQARQHNEGQKVSSLIMDGVCLARYTTNNQGHWGVNSLQYGTFTSPIRRAADLLNWRAVIDLMNRLGHDFGPGGQNLDDMTDLDALTTRLNMHERRSAAIQKTTEHRYAVAQLHASQGRVVPATIADVHENGDLVLTFHDLPVRLKVARRDVPDETVRRQFMPGSHIPVRMIEADPLAETVKVRILSLAECRAHEQAQREAAIQRQKDLENQSAGKKRAPAARRAETAIRALQPA